LIEGEEGKIEFLFLLLDRIYWCVKGCGRSAILIISLVARLPEALRLGGFARPPRRIIFSPNGAKES